MPYINRIQQMASVQQLQQQTQQQSQQPAQQTQQQAVTVQVQGVVASQPQVTTLLFYNVFKQVRIVRQVKDAFGLLAGTKDIESCAFRNLFTTGT